MEKIKKAIKFLLGEVNVYRLREMKNRVFPNHFVKKEMKEIEKRKAFYAQFVKEDDLVFDVGANIGNRVAPLLLIKARVVAVEPHDFCQKVLKLRFGKRIDVVPMGLGEKEEVKEFYISDESYLSSFSKSWIDSVKKERFRENTWDNVRKVQMTTLDKLIGKYGKPAFIKIDVEGYEMEVLKGLNSGVKMISFEYTTPEQTDRAISCVERIRSINPDIECNYSVGEGMNFEMDRFIGAEEMLKFINSDAFIQTGFGDIYVRWEGSQFF
ncbi:MAG TPA: FkbM family methyltransferase [Puia sp.]|nr:FkbM family methyltransferase [Puia sp.]